MNNIADLLPLCLDAIFLSFRGKMYQQSIKERALSTFHLPTRFWEHYVDGTCAALSPDLIQPFLDHLNCIELRIQFTVE